MTDWDPIRLVIPGTPIGKGRPRIRNWGTHASQYTPEKTANYESMVALVGQQAMAGREPLDEPLATTILVVAPIPASWSKRKQAMAVAGEIRPGGKPDVDNVIKALFDGLNKVVWRDDSLVVECLAEKWYGPTPRVEMTVKAARLGPG